MTEYEYMEFLTDLELIERLKEGSEEAFECLLERYKPFVKRIAKRYFAPGFEWEDFYQIGAMAFFNAVMTYKEDKDVTFYTYALSCIRNRIVSQYRKLSMKSEYVMEDKRLMFVMDTRAAYSHVSSGALKEEKGAVAFSYKQRLEQIMAQVKLSKLEKACLGEYMLGKRNDVIAKELGISRKQVSEALTRSRKKIREHGLSDLLFIMD